MWVYGLELRSLGLVATAFSHWAMSLVLYMLCLKTLCCIAFVVEFISIWNHLVYIKHQEETCTRKLCHLCPVACDICSRVLHVMLSLPCSFPAPFKGAPVRSFIHLCFKIDRMKAEMQIFTSVIQNVGNALVHGIEQRVPQSSKTWLKSMRSL